MEESDAGARDFRVSGSGVSSVGVGFRGDSARVEKCRGQEGRGDVRRERNYILFKSMEA